MHTAEMVRGRGRGVLSVVLAALVANVAGIVNRAAADAGHKQSVRILT